MLYRPLFSCAPSPSCLPVLTAHTLALLAFILQVARHLQKHAHLCSTHGLVHVASATRLHAQLGLPSPLWGPERPGVGDALREYQGVAFDADCMQVQLRHHLGGP
jgi:hypothetical protein